MPWGHGLGGRGDKAKVLVVRLRWPWECGQGPGGADKAALGVRPMPCGCSQSSRGVHGQGTGGTAKAAVGTQPRPWGCSQGRGGTATVTVGARSKHWGRGQGSREGAAKRPWGRS